MHKIINGKSYNPETAKQIANWRNNHSYQDFEWAEETLYRKRTGEYFLFGEGGPMSAYAQPSYGDNGWESGERIEPMTTEQAKKWAESRLDGDDYVEIFGQPEETDVDTNDYRGRFISSLPVWLVIDQEDHENPVNGAFATYQEAKEYVINDLEDSGMTTHSIDTVSMTFDIPSERVHIHNTKVSVNG